MRARSSTGWRFALGLGLSFVLGLAAMAHAQSPALADSSGWLGPLELATSEDSLRLNVGQTRIDLRHGRVLEILSARIDDRVLNPSEDYEPVLERGFVVLRRAAQGGESFWVRYRYAPTSLPSQIALHIPRPDSSAAQQEPPAALPELGVEDIERTPGLPTALQISGSKTVSVQGGSNRDPTVDQGLNLSVQGALTPTIRVRAAITDENLPITPEGNSEELRDLDQVRIELFGPRGRALVGDFRVDRRLGAFVPYDRKLQGLLLEGRATRGKAGLLGGAPQGRRLEVEIRGREGAQGPYELLDGRRLDQTLIVAGSERVWLDGVLLVRGENRDYVIDYVRGTISFTERRPVGPENRIAVDFETSATGYRRSVLGGNVDSLRVGPARLYVALLQEADDPDRPIEGELGPEDRAALESAGDDPDKALGSGVVQTAPGEGDYVERFTEGGTRYFAPADSSGGDFDVSFLLVGEGQGDYRLRGTTPLGVLDFEYVGVDGGDYVVGRSLPLPEKTQIAVTRLELGDAGLTPYMSAEVDFSRHDANQLSSLDKENDEDLAWRLEASTPWLFGKAGSGLRSSLRAESLGRNFYSLGRLRDPFFYERWNLQDSPRQQREDLQDLAADYRTQARRIGLAVQRLSREGGYEGVRSSTNGDGKILGPLHWSHGLSWMSAEREAGRRSRRRDRGFGLRWQTSWLSPFARMGDEEFRDDQTSAFRGYRDEKISVGAMAPGGGRVEFSRLVADSLASDGTHWAFARDTRKAEIEARTQALGVQWELDLNWRRSMLPENQRETTRLARIHASHRSAGGEVLVDVDYRAGNDQSRVLDRQIVFVGLGQGDYDVEGNRVGVRQGDYTVIFTPSDSLVAATDVALSARLDWRPRWRVAGGFGSNTLVQVAERSRSEDVAKVLRLAPSVLRNPETTIFGEERLRQELQLLRELRSFDLRLSYDWRQALDQRFAESVERTRDRKRLAQLETDLGAGVTLRLDVGDEARLRDADVGSDPLQRSYDVEDQTLGTILRYRWSARRRLSLELRGTRRNERLGAIDQTVFEAVPSISGDLLRGRWTLETRFVQVEETGGTDRTRPFFFERPGTGRSAALLAQWGGTGFVTVGVRYQVRDEPDRELRQDLSVETKARF